jgi:PAS domain S-box-containing protein
MQDRHSRILLVDDHAVVRNGLRALFSDRPEWKICGEAEDGIDAIEKAKNLHPDVIVMDISMPRMDGLEATSVLRKELPAAKIIIISQNDPAISARHAREVDAAAFVTKSRLSEDLLPTIEKLAGAQKPETAPEGPGEQASQASTNWLAGGGELSQLIRDHDWTATRLGPLENWPQSLKTSVNLILNSQHPMWIGWGKDITFLYNDAYIEVLSSAKHPLALGRPAAEVWAEIWDICGPLAGKVFDEGEASFVDEVRLLMNRGDYLEETYYSFSYSPIRDESGVVAGLFCPSTEVTAKVINARRLRTLSELSSHAFVQKTTEGACAVTADTLAKNPDDVPFAVLYLIDSAKQQAGLEQTCGIAKDRCAFTPQTVDLATQNEEACLWPLATVVKTGEAQLVSVREVEGLPLGVARQRLSEALVLPVTSHGEAGAIGVLVAGISPARKLDAEYRTFYDLVAGQIATAIQNARAVEEERKRLEALAEIDRAKTAFFSNVSHEFRTPLALMLGPVEELLSRSHTDLSPAAKSQLELVNRNGSRLLRLVNTLLDFSRIEAGRMQAIYQPTDLASFTLDLASVFRSATEKAGLRLELNCPKLEQPIFVDRGMWEKIVLNLISNAFKFTFDGEIAVSLVQALDHVELRIRDTGVGIPAQELPRLFDRFHRVENTRSRTHEGSGIGLALVHELVKLHGGTVRVESEFGKGSTFIVSLPMGSAHLPKERIGSSRTLATTALGATPYVEEALRWLPEAEQEIEEEILPELIPVPYAAEAGTESGSEKRPRILVADDNSDLRHYLARLLAERYEVQTVPDGQAALTAIRGRAPDLLLSDVMMPNLDGFGLLRELRSDPDTRSIPVILLSARAGEESRVEGMEHGADDYLVKPFSSRELLARVQTHLEMARVRRQGAEALLESEARATEILESISDGFMAIDRDWRITYLNARAEELFERLQKKRGVMVGKIFWEEFPDTVGTAFESNYRRAVSENTTVSFDAYYPPLDSWFEVRAYPSRTGLSLYVRDITDPKRAEERERQITAEALAATAKFRAVFEQTPVFAGIMTLDGTVIDANKLCLDACGFRAEEVLGRPFWETGWWRLSPEAQAEVRQATKQAAEGKAYERVLTYHWADGTERVVNFALHPILDHKGEILFLHPTGVDITDLKRAEEDYRRLAETLDAEVRARTSELEQRNDEVMKQSEMLRNLSHRLMRAQDEERRRIARELHDSAGQILAALGMNLARIARPRQDYTNLTKEVSDSQGLVQQLSQEIRTMSYLLHPPLLDEAGLAEALGWYVQGLMERSGLHIVLDIPKDFGRLPREMELVMFRLVQECLTNIHRHSESKEASIRMRRDAGSVSLEIEDQGKGMSREELSEIQSGGAGVGIRGMRERIRQFHGHMNIESNQRGTHISFKIPLPEKPVEKPSDTRQRIEAVG